MESREDIIVRRFLVEEVSQVEIAKEFDLTRQRILQILQKNIPNYREVRRHQKQARKIIKQRDEFNKRMRKCRVCGKPFALNKSGRHRYCSKEHYRIAYTLRYVISAEAWEKHRVDLAEYWLRNADKVHPGLVRSAKRELSGKVNRRGRWLIPGSKVFEQACEAYRKSWPIFDEFHDEIAEQIIDACSTRE